MTNGWAMMREYVEGERDANADADADALKRARRVSA
jgi:hypothetical protein